MRSTAGLNAVEKKSPLPQGVNPKFSGHAAHSIVTIPSYADHYTDLRRLFTNTTVLGLHKCAVDCETRFQIKPLKLESHPQNIQQFRCYLTVHTVRLYSMDQLVNHDLG